MAHCDRSDHTNRDNNRAGLPVGVATAPPHLPALLSATGVAALAVSSEVYSRRQVFAAAYKLSDRCAVLVDKAEDGRWLLYVVAATAGDPTPHVEALVRELCDQALRDALEAEFGSVRTLIVAQAFSEGNLLNSQEDEGSGARADGTDQDR